MFGFGDEKKYTQADVDEIRKKHRIELEDRERNYEIWKEDKERDYDHWRDDKTRSFEGQLADKELEITNLRAGHEAEVGRLTTKNEFDEKFFESKIVNALREQLADAKTQLAKALAESEGQASAAVIHETYAGKVVNVEKLLTELIQRLPTINLDSATLAINVETKIAKEKEEKKDK